MKEQGMIKNSEVKLSDDVFYPAFQKAAEEIRQLKEALATEKDRANKNQERAARYICKCFADRNVYRRNLKESNTLKAALKDVQRIAQDADIRVIVAVTNKALGEIK
jgi:hypothetical protein